MLERPEQAGREGRGRGRGTGGMERGREGETSLLLLDSCTAPIRLTQEVGLTSQSGTPITSVAHRGDQLHLGLAGEGWFHSSWPEATRLACLYSSSCFFPISWCFWLPTSPLPAREEITPLVQASGAPGRTSGNSQSITHLPALPRLISFSPSVGEAGVAEGGPNLGSCFLCPVFSQISPLSPEMSSVGVAPCCLLGVRLPVSAPL